MNFGGKLAECRIIWPSSAQKSNINKIQIKKSGDPFGVSPIRKTEKEYWSH